MPRRPEVRSEVRSRFTIADGFEGPPGLRSEDLVPLATLRELEPAARAAVRGVELGPADDLAALLPELDHLVVVAVRFEAFTDGRGYSHARRLRATHGWTGELRAIGDVRADQARSMLRCGFDALEFAQVPDEALLGRTLGRFRRTYQPSYPATAGAAAAADGRAADGAPRA